MHKENYYKSLASKKSLPLKSDQPGKHVLNCFRWNNFHCKKENLKGSIHTSHRDCVSREIRSVNSITPFGKRTFKVKACNLPVVIKPFTKSSLWVGYSKWKKIRRFQANIGSLEVRTKNTFWGKSDCSNLHRPGYSVFWDRKFWNRINIFTIHSIPDNRIQHRMQK